MKLLPENKKRTLILSGVLLIALGGIIYFNFFMNSSSDTGTPSDPLLVLSGTDATGAPVGAEGAQPGKTALLPYGTSLDLEILKQEKFKALKSFPKLEVLPEELSKENIFSQ